MGVGGLAGGRTFFDKRSTQTLENLWGRVAKRLHLKFSRKEKLGNFEE